MLKENNPNPLRDTVAAYFRSARTGLAIAVMFICTISIKMSFLDATTLKKTILRRKKKKPHQIEPRNKRALYIKV